MERVAKRMKYLRNARKLTQLEVSKRLSVHQNTYASYEKNADNLPHGMIPGLLDIFEVTFEEFYCGTGDAAYTTLEERMSKMEEDLEKYRST